MLSRNNCIHCNYKLKNIHIQKNFPIKFCAIDKFENNRQELSFSICEKCNIIQLDKLVKLEELYDRGHNYSVVGNTWKNFFKYFNNILDKQIVNKNILEIGCPSGKLAISNTNYKNWLIVDPNVRSIANSNIQTINSFFNKETKIDMEIDIIVHSHLFEHIYEPNIFLKLCYDKLKQNGRMIFAIPNMEYILKNNIAPFSGVMFEHNIFYSTTTVVNMLENNNFQVDNIYKYENHSIIFETRKVNKLVKQNIVDNTNYLDYFYNNIKYYNNFVKRCLDICNKHLDKKIYIFGASYNSQILLYLGLDKLDILGILDNCPEKQDKYLYGYNIKILSPEVLYNEDVIVILKNGYYSTEIKEQILKINKDAIII